MSIKLCLRCQAVRNMVLTTSTRTTTGPDGKVKEIRTNLFYCDTCNSFVDSEDIEFLEDFRRFSGPVNKSMYQMSRPDTLYALIGNLITQWWKTRCSLASPQNLTILSEPGIAGFPAPAEKQAFPPFPLWALSFQLWALKAFGLKQLGSTTYPSLFHKQNTYFISVFSP